MNKEHVTKGPVRNINGILVGKWNEGICQLKGFLKREPTKAKANAELIAQAFNVLHETGYTPRELAEVVRRLKDTMHSVADSLTKQGFGYGRTKSKRGLEVQEAMLVEVRLLNTVLSKHNL